MRDSFEEATGTGATAAIGSGTSSEDSPGSDDSSAWDGAALAVVQEEGRNDEEITAADATGTAARGVVTLMGGGETRGRLGVP